MRLHRFYINKQIGKEIRIDNKELLHQWQKVFRLKASDRVIIFNGGDFDYEGYFKVLARDEAVLVIEKEIKVKKSTDIELYLFQSIIKKDNFELVVEKCTEIGVKGFYPLISERSEKKDLNIERLEKIAKESAEQSGRTTIPEIFEPEELGKVISNFLGELYVLDFGGEGFAETFVLNTDRKIGLLIGPEGGWSENERDLFEDRGIKSITFGLQTLRAETAAIVASALILIK